MNLSGGLLFVSVESIDVPTDHRALRCLRRLQFMEASSRGSRPSLLHKRAEQLRAALEARHATVPPLCACPHGEMATVDADWPARCADNCALRRRPALFEELVVQSLKGFGISLQAV